ncbi:hypothetical protein A1OO_20355 [Enterovibrio norvegicus FF-33]|uniref:glycosyltransferase family 4 protein n=1 Tax=Enterovibrio norvegicus TaxID=188144 RepID=UPI00030BDD76|nr:glycosyltransferase family 4 protein [Enterovibrio norvegicus]OEE68083.1 hypothetical protein A1OO_20355 [Enterovibrio norvegicus FF-33]
MEDLIFFGELPPDVVHGVSISNDINVNILERHFNITKICYDSGYGKESNYNKKFRVLINLIGSMRYAFKKKKEINPTYFYFSLSLTNFGLLRDLVMIVWVKFLFNNMKIVTHVHRGDFHDFFVKSMCRLLLLKTLRKFVQNFIFLSHDNEVGKLLGDDCVHILENVIEEVDESELEPWVKCGENIRLLYFSNIIREKGVFEIISAFRMLSRDFSALELTFCGLPQDASILNEINAASEGLSIEVLEPPVSLACKYNTFRRSDIFILPSHNEGQPLSIIEAMYNGLAVVASDVGYIPEMFDENYAFICKPKNVSSLYDTLKLCIESNYTAIGCENRNYYFQRYSNIRHEEKIKEIFEV